MPESIPQQEVVQNGNSSNEIPQLTRDRATELMKAEGGLTVEAWDRSCQYEKAYETLVSIRNPYSLDIPLEFMIPLQLSDFSPEAIAGLLGIRPEELEKHPELVHQKTIEFLTSQMDALTQEKMAKVIKLYRNGKWKSLNIEYGLHGKLLQNLVPLYPRQYDDETRTAFSEAVDIIYTQREVEADLREKSFLAREIEGGAKYAAEIRRQQSDILGALNKSDTFFREKALRLYSSITSGETHPYYKKPQLYELATLAWKVPDILDEGQKKEIQRVVESLRNERERSYLQALFRV